MKNFLFVCTGNTCRSPMAEAVMKHLAGELVNVQSAGIFAMPGNTANDKAVQVLKEMGVNIAHQSQPLSQDLLDWADIVLTMTTEHKQILYQRYSLISEKVFTLREYALSLEGENDVWGEIKRLSAEIETKRLQFLTGQSKQGMSNEERKKMEEKFLNEVEKDYNKLKGLEAQLPSLDIADPFGSSKAIYQQTLEELFQLINTINDHLHKSGM